jgi:monoamine oxidase
MSYPFSRREFLKGGVLAAALSRSASLRTLAFDQQPLQRKGPAKKVIVVGGGLAGLSAGYELTQAGHDVTILEAQLRPGGRVLTLREPFSDGLYAEAGAARFHETHDFTLKYVQLFNLPTDPFGPKELASVQVSRGKRSARQPGQPRQLSEYPASITAGLTEEEKRIGLDGMWDKYIHSVLKQMSDPAASNWVPAALAKYDGVNFREFLLDRGASPAATVTLWNEEGTGEEFSALWMLRIMALDQKSEKTYKIRGGTDLLPKAFAARLADKILYGAPVVRIEHDERSVRVFFRQAGIQRSVSGDYLVCAIPFTVLRDIDVSPPFSPEKRRTIQELSYASASRVFLQCRKRYWRDGGFSGFGWADPLGELWHPTFDQPGARGILVSYQRSRQSRQVTEMNESERIRFTLEEMNRVFPGIFDYHEGGTSKCWDEDPWVRGAWTHFRPGQMLAQLPHIAPPEGRVHFAGEHSSAWNSWMQGALESGNRVAGEINDATNRNAANGTQCLNYLSHPRGQPQSDGEPHCAVRLL